MDVDTPMHSVEEPTRRDLYDPLTFDLPHAVRGLQATLSNDPTFLKVIDSRLLDTFASTPTPSQHTHVLNTVSQCLLNPKWTRIVVASFRPIAIDLVARWLTPGFTSFLESVPPSGGAVYRLETVAKAFSLLLPTIPQVKSLAVSYFSHSPSLFDNIHQLTLKDGEFTELPTDSIDQVLDLLLSAYRLLRFSASTFIPLWNWSPLIRLMSTLDVRVRYLTLLCLSKVYGLSDGQTQHLLLAASNRDPAQGEADVPLTVTIDHAQVDLRFLSLWEEQQLANEQIAFLHNSDPATEYTLSESDLCNLTSNLCGVLIPKSTTRQDDGLVSYQPRLILTETTKRNLHTLSLALSIGAPTLLEGATGSGKTALVEELASRTGRGDKLIKIHLGDQTDPKVLLGTYVSTSTPGSFRWQAGVLTTAVQEGRWVLIEDIDLAPAEVLSVLLPLLETKHLFIPSRGEKIKAKEGFQLFGTRSFVPNKAHTLRGKELVSGGNLWTHVHVDALTMDELEHVVRHKYPRIGDFATHVLNLFQVVVDMYSHSHFSSSTMGRFVSTRDLMKWCHRMDALFGARLDKSQQLDKGFDQKIREDLFSEAIDCFCGMIPDYATWVAMLEKVGEPLQISADRVQHYVDQYKPALEVSDTTVCIGRVNLSALASGGKQKQGVVKRERRRPFATTGHALRLMERISVCVYLNEPVLLVGETGTGKTTVVQHLADMMHQNLVAVNLSQQTDSSDLLGGFKPVEGRILAIPLKEEFDGLFGRTFSVKKNEKFLDMVRKTYVHQKWKKFVVLLQQAVKMADQKFDGERNDASKKASPPQLRTAWKAFHQHLQEFEVQQVQSQNKFVFNFMEGALVKAVRQGDWILLDEINLATTETLECLSGLLQDAEGSLLLTEKGDVEPIQRHPNFRLFACMNPATDVGKRDLPPGLRNRFTEFYVHSPDTRYEDLLQIVKRYLGGIAIGDERACEDVAEFYGHVKRLSQEHKLVDGANQRPHFSMRTLSRALLYVLQIFPTYGLRRSLYEGFCMTFLTQLDKESEALVRQAIFTYILRGVKDPKHLISQIPKRPSDNFVQFGHFWLEHGPFEPQEDGQYILTPSVETNLYNLARVIMSRKFPVLIQGPTSAGKTSMIEYLAKRTGHRFVRINNHEHTDLQEYLGTYVSNNEGKLVFQEGVLVEALRNGYWIVLDELNLAPSDVLEALNRLLDDNRELLIPETQEIVKPHPHFMLFATQNPAGLYGGRKALSRAFRNRFLELHFDDIPQDELETILSKRCRIAPSYCKRLVQVYKSLMERRKSSRLFEQKHSFITLRDLFRWAGRDPDSYQDLAEHGYMLLAERCRKEEEKKVVKEVLETVMKVKLSEEEMYNCERLEEFAVYDRMLREKATQSGGDTKLVWTKAMRRLFSLVARCLRYNEPVLLVGETGCGKTTVCQMLAETHNRKLHIVNCHQNTETGDLLGGQRPVRASNKEEDVESGKQTQLFEWHDGPLVQSLRDGDLFLLDEISLADDSVLERLNSVLEPSRLLVLAEKSGKHVEELTAAEGFQFLATMNPGGDYGKKELSPALRNRFTEIWVPFVDDPEDLTLIINEQLQLPALQSFAPRILDFVSWFTKALNQSRTVVSLRDILSWVQFLNTAVASGLDPDLAFTHGGCLVLLDGLGSHGASGSILAGRTLQDFRLKCLRQLSGRATATSEQAILGDASQSVHISESALAIGPFQIERGSKSKADVGFTLSAKTTADNAMRVVRAMQLKKPVLLEGSPGVGKTSLISALAAASGHPLVRINLSEQTDLMDLFGSDLPVENGNSGEFAWRDAPFLQAMKAGHWVLLDELNLASQSVLEGLNSCLDHRGAVYIPELDREFFCAPGFRVFGAQNPLQQGGGRKGLPKSFVNRFTQVYVEHLSAEDLLFICAHLFPDFDPAILEKMIEFNRRMYEETMVRCRFGRKGSPWEFNLRDVFRWLELMRRGMTTDPAEYLGTIYLQRMRSQDDRDKVVALFEHVFGTQYTKLARPSYCISSAEVRVGHAALQRLPQIAATDALDSDTHMLHTFLSPLEALMKCVDASWMSILTGPSASGKTSLVRLLSRLTGNKLQEFAMNNSVDTMELLGGFEQVDLNRHRQVVLASLNDVTRRTTRNLLMQLKDKQGPAFHAVLQSVRTLNDAWYAVQNHAPSSGFNYTLLASLVKQLQHTCDATDREMVQAMTADIAHVQALEQSSVAGKFEWIDGLLIHALEQGHWLLIDNANLCNPSVLDRLNPLFENDGVLMVNERGLVDGQVKVIKPHPNFRMFMTVDPNHGELSRAMRNRGIEIALLDSDWCQGYDVTKLANSLGVRGAALPRQLRTLQDAMPKRQKSVRDYLMLATFVVERLQRGQVLRTAIADACQQTFGEWQADDGSLLDVHAALEALLSPGDCPYFIGGALFEHDASLAMIALHGAYLTYLVQQEPCDLTKVELAGDYFLEACVDANLGLRWLAFVAQHAKTENAALDRLAYLFKALRDDGYTFTGQGGEEHRLCIRLHKMDYASKMLEAESMRLKPKSMNALQQSFTFQGGRLSESMLSHPTIKEIEPLFRSIQEALRTWVHSKAETPDALTQLLDCRDYCWNLCQAYALSLDNYVILLRHMKQIITESLALQTVFGAVVAQIEKILSGFNQDACKNMKALWQYFGPATLCSETLFNTEQRMLEVNASLDVYRAQRDGLKPNDLVLRTPFDVKEMWIEGIATLYTLNENSDKNARSLAKSLDRLPEHLKRQLEAVEAPLESTPWDTALIPLYDYASLVNEMEILSMLFAGVFSDTVDVQVLKSLLQRFRNFALKKTSRPPLDLLTYQRLIWLLDSADHDKLKLLLPGLIQDALRTWHARLWRSSLTQKHLYELSSSLILPNKEKMASIADGSSSLYQSVETVACLNILLSVNKMPSEAYANALELLKSLKGHLATSITLLDRRVLEFVMVVSSAHQILDASSDLMEPAFYATQASRFQPLLAFASQLQQSDLYTPFSGPAYDEAQNLLEAMVTDMKQHNFNPYYVSALSHLATAVSHLQNDHPDYLTAVGRARAFLGLAFISAYIPDYPADPTAEPRLRVDLLVHQKDACLAILGVRTETERVITGNDTNATIAAYQQRVADVDDALAQSVTTFSLRPAKSQLEDIFNDLCSLRGQMLSKNTVTFIEHALQDAASAPQRESLIQGNALQFIDRIHAKYPKYRDMLQPIVVAVDDVKYGLRLTLSRTNPSDAFLASVVELFARTHSLPEDLDWHALAREHNLKKLRAIVFERAPTSRKWAFYLSLLIVVLEKLALRVNVHGYFQDQDIVALDTVFSEIVYVWKAAEEYKREKEAEREQMYKTRAKKYEPATDEEQEEQERKALFANFEDLFADLTMEDGQELQQQDKTPAVHEESVLNDADLQRIGMLHKSLFDTYRRDSCTRVPQDADLRLRSHQSAAQLATMASSAFVHTLDPVCHTGHLVAVASTLQRLEAEHPADDYDFYTSEHIGEAKRVEPVVRRFKARVQQILRDWPEHAVLAQLDGLCDRLLSFSIVSPIAKFLTGVEVLLQKSEDWEAYAAKHVSLKANREELTGLIVRWRQLELNCWPKLLAAQEKQTHAAAYTWWSHLYDTVRNTTFHEGDAEATVDKVRGLLAVLDQFIQSATLGEFQARLKMLDSFARQTELLTDDASLRILSTVLRNVHHYYAQFVDHAALMHKQLRQPIEKDLKDFVKIASWKDVNVYALRQSAQKTHRQLHKCIRKYRDALNTPMLSVIANYNEENAMFQYGDEKRYNDLYPQLAEQLGRPDLWMAAATTVPTATHASLPPAQKHLANLQLTLNHFRRYCREDLLQPGEVPPLESFMTGMIEQIKDFQKETPAIMTDENKSTVKNQKLLKKKALVDFLKELRRLGLRSRPGTLAERNADLASLFERPVASLDEPLWTRANDYYYRCVARMSHLRTISRSQVKDVTQLEVERGMSATEHVFSLVTKERTLATRFQDLTAVLDAVLKQLQPVQHAPLHASLAMRFLAHKLLVDDLVAMLSEAHAIAAIQAEYETRAWSMQPLLASLRTAQKETDACFAERFLAAQKANLDVLLTEEVEAMIQKHEDVLETVRTSLVTIAGENPTLKQTVHAILAHLDARMQTSHAREAQGEEEASLAAVQAAVYGVIDAILVSAQDLKKLPAPVKPKAEDDDGFENGMADNHIKDTHEAQFATMRALHLETVAQRCMDAFQAVQNTVHKAEATVLLQQLAPFLEQYTRLTQHHRLQFLLHHKSLAKLAYAFTNSFTLILSKGFCMPANADEEEGEGESEGTATGTGIGEGEGQKDVSNEIEDEEQVLGTQNEERQEQKDDTKEEKEGLEMENDFEGNLEDVEDDGQDEQSDKDDEEDDEEELDDEIGDVNDLDGVDDKMWGDEEAPEDNRESDKTVDQQGQSEQQESDVVAKDEEDEQAGTDDKQDKPQEQKPQPEGDENQPQPEGEEQQEDMEGGEDQDEEEPESKGGEQMNVEVPEAETLELPDDMDVDDNERQGDQEEEDEGMEDALDQLEDDAMQQQKDEEDETMQEGEEGTGEEQFKDALDVPETQDEEDQEMADTTAQKEQEEQEEEEQEEEHPTGDGENAKVEGEENEAELDEQPDSAAQNQEQPAGDDTSTDNQFGVQGQRGKASMSSAGKQQNDQQDEGESGEPEVDEAMDQKPGMAEHGTSQADQEVQKEEKEGDEEGEEDEEAKAKTNPERSLGDALQDWRRRLADVTDADEDEEEQEEDGEAKKEDEREAQVNEEHAFEYVKNDEEAHDTQTMGNAAPDQVQNIPMAMDADMQDEEQVVGEETENLQEEEPTQPMEGLLQQPEEASSDREQGGGAIASRELRDDVSLAPEGLTVDESVVAHEPLEAEDMERMRHELEATVSEWREEGRDLQQARDLWQQYENLTQDLAMGLCEQLRLILEPTLATKLKGDYRTGKRLNMKKIIPYIASQFKKDKIWLRRTKPSKRQYQVMISIDDSKSMSESHAVQLAYETLTLVSKALSQLEVGDIAITSFGERIRLLHPFEQPFSGDAGASVLQQFTFAQQKTQVKSLLETSLALFESAKATHHGSQDLWQLQLVISDGICDDHDALRTLVRRAMEEQVMIIFIVVDNKPEKDSILTMNSVKYATVNGKLSLQMTPYLETFPFQYFMILRDINALPHALSDALRQYFSFVSQ